MGKKMPCAAVSMTACRRPWPTQNVRIVPVQVTKPCLQELISKELRKAHELTFSLFAMPRPKMRTAAHTRGSGVVYIRLCCQMHARGSGEGVTDSIEQTVALQMAQVCGVNCPTISPYAATGGRDRRGQLNVLREAAHAERPEHETYWRSAFDEPETQSWRLPAQKQTAFDPSWSTFTGNFAGCGRRRGLRPNQLRQQRSFSANGDPIEIAAKKQLGRLIVDVLRQKMSFARFPISDIITRQGSDWFL